MNIIYFAGKFLLYHKLQKVLKYNWGSVIIEVLSV